jgi:hypothetical protein
MSFMIPAVDRDSKVHTAHFYSLVPVFLSLISSNLYLYLVFKAVLSTEHRPREQWTGKACKGFEGPMVYFAADQ